MAPPSADLSCTPVSVKGGATYCISGRVCSDKDSSLSGTNCPKKGDVAISRCHSTLRTYNAAAGNCVAQQDAQCEVIETGVWGCVFAPHVAAESLAESVPVEIMSAVQPNTISVTGTSVARSDQASTIAASVFAANADPPKSTSQDPSNAALSGAVAVAALVVAAFGVALARNRQREGQVSRSSSILKLSRLEELSTPI